MVADIPGLIEGAHTGERGWGFSFCVIVERTRLLLHMVDAADIDADQPLKDFETDQPGTACNTAPLLANKPQLVVLNKMDVDWAEDAAAHFPGRLTAKAACFCSISAATGQGPRSTHDQTPSATLLDQLDEVRS